MITATRLLLCTFPSLLLTTDPASAQCEALHFDGTDDIASVLDNNNDFDMADALTLEAWFQVDVTQTGAGLIGGTTSGGGGAYMFGGGIGTPSDGVFAVSTPGTDAVSAPGVMVPGPWQHMAGSFDGTNLELYINGLPVASNIHSSPGTSSDVVSLVFGRFPVTGSGLFFNGTMDELRVWNVIRTPAEVLATYNVALNGNEPGLMGYYKFNEGTGDAILDSSINGNDGYLGGAVGPGSDDPTRVPSGIPFGSCAAPGTQYCPGDGVSPHTLCPCANNNDGSMGGCDWGDLAFPEGGVLTAVGSDSMAANDTVLEATGVADDFGIFFGANNQVNGGNGNPLNDGLRCAGGGLVRLIPPTMASGNQLTLPAPLQTLDTGAAAGVTRRYQYWFRTPGGPCGQMANLSNGYELVWMP